MGVPSALQALSHQLRWDVVRELSRSDRNVGELVLATGAAQNLVSYHLKLLREAGLVRERRSSADGRDVYYILDRRALRAGLLGSLEAALARPVIVRKHAPTRRKRLPAVLFLCTGNSARSQIAEALLHKLAGIRLKVRSAGTHPMGVHPLVPEVLRRRGITIAGLRSKPLSEFSSQPFDYAITLCDIARSEQPRLAGRPVWIHWSVPDPAAVSGGRSAQAAAIESAAEEIALRVEEFHADLISRPRPELEEQR